MNKIILMKKIQSLLILFVTFLFVISCSENIETKKIETEREKVSYSVGLNLATNIQQQGLDSVDAYAIAKAFNDVFSENELTISQEEANTILQEFSQKLQKRAQNKKMIEEKERTEINKKILSESSENKIILPSGLEIERLENGEGESPLATDTVTVHYTGMLSDGTIFDSSVERDEPATFPVKAVIPGWVEGLQLMKVGDKWKLTIPSDLGYGENGVPQANIPPNATLIFEVELLKIN